MQVKSIGTGRKDYSQNVEYATIPTVRSHQQRHVTLGAFPDIATGTEMYGYDWPYMNAVALWWPESGTDYLFTQKMVAVTEANKLVIISLVAYSTYDDYDAGGTPIEYYGTATGYGRAELIWSKGVVYDATRCFVMYFSVISDNPYPSQSRGNYLESITFNFSIHSIKEKIIYGA